MTILDSAKPLGRFDDAIISFTEAIRINRQSAQTSPWPALNLGSLLLKLNRIEEAEPFLRQSIQQDSRLAKAHYQLGLLLEKQLKYAGAVQELKEAAELDPSYPEPHYRLSRIYRKQGEKQNAETALNHFQKLNKAKTQVLPNRKLLLWISSAAALHLQALSRDARQF